MSYEELLIEADSHGLIAKEKPLLAHEGRIKGNKIAINKNMTEVKKACALAEELGHYYTNVGDILDQEDVSNRKQELKAKLWAYDKQIGLSGLIRAYEHGCHDQHTTADFLNVSEEFLQEAIDCYRDKYGEKTVVDKYTIQFEPYLQVISPYDEMIIVYTRNSKKLSYEEKLRLARIILSDEDEED